MLATWVLITYILVNGTWQLDPSLPSRIEYVYEWCKETADARRTATRKAVCQPQAMILPQKVYP